MGSSKRRAPAVAAPAAKERHKRTSRMLHDTMAPLPEGLVARPAIPKLKHKTYFEIVENKNKKKKLEFKITTDKKPPPGFEFVPMGNPTLTTACKEISREQDAMIFIVSNSKDSSASLLGHQVHRIGHHIRQTIVEEAKATLDVIPADMSMPLGAPEPIPASQTQYNAQVDAAIRDLFPRIPNTDRQLIIEHAFDFSAKDRKGEKPVGLSADITLARRVQLAVLAHIRHTHTRYDCLLKETSWFNARRVVESLCLDILVKWRGDEESGRDQLDEILQEVVVISDMEESDDDDDDDADECSVDSDSSVEIVSPPSRAGALPLGSDARRPALVLSSPHEQSRYQKRPRASGKQEQRGFKRYRAWQQAIERNKGEEQSFGAPLPPVNLGVHADARRLHTTFPVGTHRTLQPRSGEGVVGSISGQGHSHPMSYPTSEPGPHGTAPLRQVPMAHLEGLSPHRPPSPPIQDRFKDLLVRSIEPASPNTAQPSFVRTRPSRSPDPRNHRPVSYDEANGSYSSMPIADPHIASRFAPPPRRIISDLAPQESDFPGGFIQVSHGLAPDSQRLPLHNVAPRQLVDGPVMSRARTRPREVDYAGDRRPPKRTLLAAPPLDRSAPQFYMEDRGGFLEKVPLYQDDARSVPPDPGFVEIRRPPAHEFAVDRVVSHEEGRRLQHEPGVEIIPVPSSPIQVPEPSPQRASRPLEYPVEPMHRFPARPSDMSTQEYSRPQRVFRHVRGSEPGVSHYQAPRYFDEHAPSYRDPLHQGHHTTPHAMPAGNHRPDPAWDMQPGGRPAGQHSHRPIVLD